MPGRNRRGGTMVVSDLTAELRSARDSLADARKYNRSRDPDLLGDALSEIGDALSNISDIIQDDLAPMLKRRDAQEAATESAEIARLRETVERLARDVEALKRAQPPMRIVG